MPHAGEGEKPRTAPQRGRGATTSLVAVGEWEREGAPCLGREVEWHSGKGVPKRKTLTVAFI